MKAMEWIMTVTLKLTAFLLRCLSDLCRAIGNAAGYLEDAAGYLDENLPAWIEAGRRMAIRVRERWDTFREQMLIPWIETCCRMATRIRKVVGSCIQRGMAVLHRITGTVITYLPVWIDAGRCLAIRIKSHLSRCWEFRSQLFQEQKGDTYDLEGDLAWVTIL